MADYYVGLDGKITTNKKKKKSDYHVGLDGTVLGLDIAPVVSDDIAPVINSASSTGGGAGRSFGSQEEEERTWFNKGVVDDNGILKTILGSGVDVSENLSTGVIGMGEKFADLLAYVAPAVSASQNSQNSLNYQFDIEDYRAQQKESADFIAKDWYDEEKIAKAIISDNARKIGIDAETQSIFGEKSDALAQSAGQLGATVALQSVGVPWFMTTGATSFGAEAENALNQGATYEEAGLSAAITAGAEILSEKISGGISFGGKTLDAGMSKLLYDQISNKVVRTLAKLGWDAAGEGAEEVLSQVFSNLGTALYKEESLGELLASEEALDGYIESFIGGAVLGGGSSSINAVKTSATGRDYVTGLTENEQKVVDKIYKDKTSEEENGKKLTGKEKAKIYDDIIKSMDRGYIDIETIEDALGGETLKQYNDQVKYEEDIKSEYAELNKLKQIDMTGEQSDRRTELKQILDDLKKNKPLESMKGKLRAEVQELVKSDRLAESYNEELRKGQSFEVDVNKYTNEYALQTVKNFIEHANANNTNQAHDYLDMLARISEGRGYTFDFATTKHLEDSIKNGNKYNLTADPKDIEAFVSKKDKTIVINMDAKKSLPSLAGHEITHTLENVNVNDYKGLQEVLFKYAKTKGEYDDRLESVMRRYAEKYWDSELTADMLGDYIFTDEDFVRSLSVEKPNIFQKVYNEIKYLFKMATAGSREARELERVKHTFEKVWQEASGATEAQSDADTDAVQHSLADGNGAEFNKKPFWSGSVSLADGVIEEVHSYKEAENADFHHSLYFSPEQVEKMEEGTNGFFWVEKGKINGDWRESIPNDIIEKIENQIIKYSVSDSNSEKAEDNIKMLDGGSVTRYSLSTWTPQTQTNVKNNLIKAGYESERVDKWIKDVNSIASAIALDKDRLDFTAADNQTMLKNNQEYVKTLDASTLCAKRLAYQGTFNAIQHRLPNTMLSSDDLIDLLNIMKKHGVETPCSVCYVESRRRHLGKFAQEWLNGYDGEYKPSLDEVTTSDGLEALRSSHPQTYKDFVDAMNKKGSSNPKVVQLRTEYRNEIMSLTPKQIEKIESIGGLRVQSFSDFETPHLLDMMQAVMDMSAKGLTSQAYTKVPNFAWVFGDTGIKINLSLIAEGDGFDSDGNLAFSSVEGMDINDAMALRDAYSDNVGTIIVGANDKHILACMADARIDYIIPFHRSGWGQRELSLMGLDSYKDYTYGQNEHDLETGKNVANLYPPDYWNYNLSGKENAERYLNLCAKTGREPKFSNFLVDNGDGSYSLQPDGSTDGYWKTLIDFKMYNNEGNGVEQQKVQPNFNMNEAYRVLNEYEGGANKLPVAEDVVEEFVSKYNSEIAPMNSLANDQPYKEYGNFNIYSKDIKLQDPMDIAPSADIAPVETTPDDEPSYQLRDTTEMIEDIAPVQPAEEKEQVAKILHEEPVVEREEIGFGSTVMENFVDKGYVFEKLSKKTKNRELEAKWNYIRYAEGMAQDFLGNGTDGVKALVDIIEDVEHSGLEYSLEEYVYHLHNIDRMSLSERFEGMEDKAVFGDSVTADVSRAKVAELEAKHPKLKKYANELYSINNYLRGMLVDGGVISQETADLWAEMYPHFMPIRRAGEHGLNINVPLDTGRTGVNAPVKQATGGNSDILPLFDTIAQRALQTYKAVAKNRFGVELKNTLGTVIEADTADVDGIIEGVEKQDDLLKEGKNGRKPTFTVFEDGERVTFEITEEMYDALKPTNKHLAKTYKIPNAISSAHRGILTQYNPSFLARNAIKDSQDVLINSQHPVKTYANFPKAINEMRTNGKWYKEYLKNGGERNTYFDKQTNTFVEDSGGLSRVLGMPLRAINRANDYVERLPRLAEYIASREEGRSIEVSMLDAARVTTNFAAGGDVTKFLNKNGATFLNASVQGAMQQVRNVQEARMNGAKGWVQLAARYAIAGLPAVLLNGLLWDDDEEYEELSDYVKQNYYIVAKYGDGKFVRIPKGRTLAVIQNAFEQTMNALTGDDEVDLASFVELAISNLAPNNPVENNIISPIIQVANNETWYGEDLVPTRLQDLPDEEQYDESIDTFSKWLGGKIGQSPYKINYLLDQYSGGIGDSILPMLTPEAETADDTLASKMLAPIRDAFVTDSVLNNQNVSDFYDLSDELTKNANKSAATDEDVLSNKYFNSVKTQIGKLYAEKREVQNSDISDSEKYYLVRDIQKKINALAENALNEYDSVNVDNEYSSVGDAQYRKTESGWTKITDKQIEKQDEITSSLGITPAEYWDNKEEYDYAYESPGKYSIAKTVGGYDAYKAYSDELKGIKGKKDANGNTVKGSEKENKKAYIFSLDLDYGQKAILYRANYDSKEDKETYNADILEYLSSRKDISWEDKVAILEELDIEW